MTAVPLDYTKLTRCEGCGVHRDSFACDDGWRCTRCRPKDWTPPADANARLRAHGGWLGSNQREGVSPQ